MVQTLIGLLSAALLGPAGKGTASLAVTVATLGGASLFLSLHVGIVYAANEGDRRAVLRAVAVVAGLACAVLALGLVTGVGAIGSGSSERQHALLLGLAAIILDAPVLVVLRSIQGLGNSRAYRTGSLIRVAVYAIVTLAFAAERLTPSGLVTAFIAADAVTLIYGAAALRRGLVSLGALHSTGRVPIFRQSIRAHFALLSQQASYRTDIILLGALSTSSELGQYAVATAIAEALWVLSEAISLSVFATTAAQRSRGDKAGIDLTLARAIRANTLACAIGAAIIAAGSYPLFYVFLPAYRPAFRLVLILLPGIIVGGAARVFNSSAIGAGRARFVRVSAVISLTLTPVYVPFILIGSATGAALASDVIYFLMVACLVGYAHRHKQREEFPR